MAFVVEENKSLDPVDISLFGSFAVMPRQDRLPDLVEQLGLWRGWRCRRSVFDTQPAINHSKRLVDGSPGVDCFHHDCSPRWSDLPQRLFSRNSFGSCSRFSKARRVNRLPPEAHASACVAQSLNVQGSMSERVSLN